MPINATEINTLNVFLTSFFAGLTALFTLLLVLFAMFQWRAIEKQNAQNLFKMRIEHHLKFNSLNLDMAILINDDQNNDIDSLLNKLKLHLYQFEKIVSESKYLFDDEIYSLETFIVEDTKRIIKLLKKDYKSQIKETTDSQLLKEARDNIKIKFDKYLKL